MTIEALYDMVTRMQSSMATMGEQIKGALRRIDEQKQLTDSVHSLALSVKELVLAQQHTADAVKKLEADVGALKERPAKRWESVVGAIITGAVGIAVGYFFKR